jgi:hypothetical protein
MAWDEYALGRDEGGDPREWAEFETSFVPWVLDDWDPARYAPKRRRKKGEAADEVADGTGEAIAMHRGRPAMTPARYLAARDADKLDSFELSYLEEAGSQPFTFCQVVSAEPGRLLTLRDILRRQEVTVHEQRASRVGGWRW